MTTNEVFVCSDVTHALFSKEISILYIPFNFIWISVVPYENESVHFNDFMLAQFDIYDIYGSLIKKITREVEMPLNLVLLISFKRFEVISFIQMTSFF